MSSLQGVRQAFSVSLRKDKINSLVSQRRARIMKEWEGGSSITKMNEETAFDIFLEAKTEFDNIGVYSADPYLENLKKIRQIMSAGQRPPAESLFKSGLIPYVLNFYKKENWNDEALEEATWIMINASMTTNLDQIFDLLSPDYFESIKKLLARKDLPDSVYTNLLWASANLMVSTPKAKEEILKEELFVDLFEHYNKKYKEKRNYKVDKEMAFFLKMFMLEPTTNLCPSDLDVLVGTALNIMESYEEKTVDFDCLLSVSSYLTKNDGRAREKAELVCNKKFLRRVFYHLQQEKSSEDVYLIKAIFDVLINFTMIENLLLCQILDLESCGIITKWTLFQNQLLSKSALQLVANIMIENPKCAEFFLKNNLLGSIQHLLIHSYTDTKCEAVYTLKVFWNYLNFDLSARLLLENLPLLALLVNNLEDVQSVKLNRLILDLLGYLMKLGAKISEDDADLSTGQRMGEEEVVINPVREYLVHECPMEFILDLRDKADHQELREEAELFMSQEMLD